MACTRGSKKSAKRVRNCKGNFVCVRYGDPSMSIKKHIPSRKKSFCARHKCSLKRDPGTPGYQSCKAWNCKTGKVCKKSKTRNFEKRKVAYKKCPRSHKRIGSKCVKKKSRCSNGYRRVKSRCVKKQ